MPILKSRNNHIKIFRPNGTRYANGRSTKIQEAVANAFAAFYLEFGFMPNQEETSIEIIGATAIWDAAVVEVKEPKDGVSRG